MGLRIGHQWVSRECSIYHSINTKMIGLGFLGNGDLFCLLWMVNECKIFSHIEIS